MNISKEIYENNFDENVEFDPIADDRLDSTFTVIGENGEETVCEILFTYHDDDTNKDYIVYTDNSIDNEGNTRVFASIFNPNEKNLVLYPIETDEEWSMIERALKSIINDLNHAE